MKFEIFKNDGGKFQFNLKANNGQVVLTSQGYAGKDGAKNGVESVKKNCGNSDQYERKEAKNGKFHFNLLAGNKQVIGSSQMYASKDGMEKGIKSVMGAGDAEIKDLTAAE